MLAPALLRHFGQGPPESPGAHERLLGADHLSGVVFVDQSPISKDRALNPVATWAPGRHPQAVRRHAAGAPAQLHAGKFSFNSGDGRCPTCGGSGFERRDAVLSDVYLRCPDCNGQRYRPRITEVKIRRHAVGELRAP